MKSVHSILCLFAMMICFGQLVRCAGMKAENKSLYALDPGRPDTLRDSQGVQQVSYGPSGLARDQILEVRKVSIAPPFDGLSLIHRRSDGTYVKDYYSDWVAPPEELLSTELLNWLSESAPFASVVDGRSAAPHRFVLETSITSLCGDFQDSSKPRVVLNARVYLIDETAVNRSIAWQNRYDISIPIEVASAQQLVLGSGRACRKLLESLTHDLSNFREQSATARLDREQR